ncbi:MAG: DUF6766 family protein [Frankiaceae bacterium]
MPRRGGFLRDNSLTLTFIALFVMAAVIQALSGWHVFNDEQQVHGEQAYSLGRYLVSSDYGADLMDNWQSEFLQFASFIALSIWLRQRGSTESREVGESPLGSDEEQKLGRYAEPDSPLWARMGGWRRAVYSNSLLALMLALWIGSWAAASVTSWTNFNQDQQEHHQGQVSYVGYLGSADFWNLTTQNWQSEFMAVASMSVFSVLLRQRGSAQSKPVGEPHEATGVSN